MNLIAILCCAGQFYEDHETPYRARSPFKTQHQSNDLYTCSKPFQMNRLFLLLFGTLTIVAQAQNPLEQLSNGEIDKLLTNRNLTFGCSDVSACNYTPQGLSAAQYIDSLGLTISGLMSMGFDSNNLIGMEYGGGVIYDADVQEALLTLQIVHPPYYPDAPVPNMGLPPGSACGAGGQFGGTFVNALLECEALVLEGFEDWTLPTIEQVETVYNNLFYSPDYPLNVCATGLFGHFKGIDYLSATATCRCYFGNGATMCDAPASNAYEYFPVRQEVLEFSLDEFECLYPSFESLFEVACDSLTWLDGITYTASTNEPSIALTNAAGCDSIVTLDLTVNYTTYNTIDTTVVNVLEYNGEEYTEGGEYLVYLENEAGCDSIITLKLTVEYVGVDDLETPVAWSVYPNPIESQLTISSANTLESHKVQIFNALGQVIWSERVSNQVTIEVDSWPRGLYVIEIQGEGVETRERMQIVLK